MKKAMALILSLVVCFSVAACSKANKYVGTYEETSVYYESYSYNADNNPTLVTTLVLKQDGSGTYEEVITKEGKAGILKVGDVIRDGTVTWTSDDENVVITIDQVTHFDRFYGGWFDGEKRSFTLMYELKADHLVNDKGVAFTKVS